MSSVFWYILACYIVFGGICTFASYKLLTDEQKEDHKEVLSNTPLKWILLGVCLLIYPLVIIYFVLRLLVFFVCDKVASLFKRKSKE